MRIICRRRSKKISTFVGYCFILTSILVQHSIAQVETETAPIQIGRIWTSIVANGSGMQIDFSSGFFPNDYDILQYNGNTSANFNGSGFKMACTNWYAPAGLIQDKDGNPVVDTTLSVALFGSTSTYQPNGVVTDPISNRIRYGFTKQLIDTRPIIIDPTGTVAAIAPTTEDQFIDGTYKNILGVTVQRRIRVWSQSFNDNYIIYDIILKNVGPDSVTGYPKPAPDTLHNFYFWMAQGMDGNTYSQGSNPTLSTVETPKYRNVWQHYYGARKTDSLRIFYFYHADDPNQSGDDMGSPILSQKGRLLNTNFVFYTILHASKQPYVSPGISIDDSTQPKVTYIGNENLIPSPSAQEDEFENKNFWALRGGFADRNSMDTLMTYPGTHHMINNDELETSNFANFQSGNSTNNQTRNMSAFGPYEFPPNTNLRFVYAVGIAGIGLEKSKEIGEKWFNGTLIEEPPNMPSTTNVKGFLTGRLPSKFDFSTDNEIDHRKDRWISMGIDSVHLAAWRALWNFRRSYRIPIAPPPPDTIILTAVPYRTQIYWSRNWNLPANFAGYRIMRRVSDADTVFYDTIFDSDTTGLKGSALIFVDSTVRLGAQYYYYIQTKALIAASDANADPTTCGKIIYSGRNYIPNYVPLFPPGPAQNDLSKIRIVPNPYNINDPLLDEYGYGTSQYGRRHINFYNLPVKVTIKIFTENGDLVRTLEHDSPVGSGYDWWDMLTTSQQTVNSGVYIAVFQKPDGAVSFQKFIIIR